MVIGLKKPHKNNKITHYNSYLHIKYIVLNKSFSLVSSMIWVNGLFIK